MSAAEQRALLDRQILALSEKIEAKKRRSGKRGREARCSMRSSGAWRGGGRCWGALSVGGEQ